MNFQVEKIMNKFSKIIGLDSWKDKLETLQDVKRLTII